VRLVSLLTVGALAVLVAGCGTTTSAPSPAGNKYTCRDFAHYDSWVQTANIVLTPKSTWLHHQDELASKLKLDGPTARSHALSSEASRAVAAIGIPPAGQRLANQMNASEWTCLGLGYPAWGPSS
jgi:hypothetical protein